MSKEISDIIDAIEIETGINYIEHKEKFYTLLYQMSSVIDNFKSYVYDRSGAKTAYNYAVENRNKSLEIKIELIKSIKLNTIPIKIAKKFTLIDTEYTKIMEDLKKINYMELCRHSNALYF